MIGYIKECDYCGSFDRVDLLIDDGNSLYLCYACYNEYKLFLYSQMEAQIEREEWDRTHDPEWDYGDSPDLYD